MLCEQSQRALLSDETGRLTAAEWGAVLTSLIDGMGDQKLGYDKPTEAESWMDTQAFWIVKSEGFCVVVHMEVLTHYTGYNLEIAAATTLRRHVSGLSPSSGQ